MAQMITTAADAAFLLKNPPERREVTIRTMPMTKMMFLVLSHEMRRKPVAKVPMMAPRVEKSVNLSDDIARLVKALQGEPHDNGGDGAEIQPGMKKIMAVMVKIRHMREKGKR